MAGGGNEAEALKTRGNAQKDAGNLEDAAASYRSALQIAPDFFPAQYNLGLVLRELGRRDEALEAFSRAATLAPRDPETLIHLGTLLQERGRFSEAARVLAESAALAPDSGQAAYYAGHAADLAGDPQAARILLERSLLLDPHSEHTHVSYGLALMHLNRAPQAAEHFRAAVRRFPSSAELSNNFGCALLDAGRTQEAEAAFAAALELDPTRKEARFNLGDSLLRRGENERAAQCYGEGLRLHPGNPSFRERLLFASLQVCDWSRYDELVRERRADVARHPDVATSPHGFILIPSSGAEQRACAAAYARRLESYAVGARGRLAYVARGAPGKRVRVGYFSADFREHVTAYVLADLFETHDRSSIEVFAYSCVPDDGSDLRRRIAAATEHFVDVDQMNDEEIAARIMADGIDVLVDLNGYTDQARGGVVTLRPAPVQVNFLGYPGTLGSECIDYIVVDRFLLEGMAPGDLAEQPVVMPGCYAPNDRRRRITPPPPRAALGLPEDATVLCAFNHVRKITPEVFASWMRLLQALPGSVLWLLEGDPKAGENLKREAAARGVAAGRLVFSPRVPTDQYLGRLSAADLFLDTFPCTAHTTAADALWAGLPVVTRTGSTFVSRVAGSMLSAAGLPELVTSTEEEYEALVLSLARSPDKRAALRERLAKARADCPLFDTPAFARALEAAYAEMTCRYRAGEPPAPLVVPG